MKIYKDVVMKDINDVKPYFNNPRNNRKTIDILKKSIEKYGFNQPILIDKGGVIVKGHARYFALKELGVNEIPCIISHNSDEQNKADRIMDNKIPEFSSWDMDSLTMELRDIDDDLLSEGFNLVDDFQYSTTNEDINNDVDGDTTNDKDIDTSIKINDRKVDEKVVICPKCKYTFKIIV